MQASTVMMLYFYIRNLETMVSADSLTRLNNRGQIDRYMEQVQYRENVNTYAMMLDIDHFKEINDSFGHAEGDRALVILADSLKTVVRNRSTPIFLARFGGDEFILIAHLKDEDALKELIREIRAEIAAQCRAAGTPYQISVGIGYSELRQGQDSFQLCMQRADQNLYLDKERCKRPD